MSACSVDFVPPVELEEVQLRFQQSRSDLEARIRGTEQSANDYCLSLEDRVTQILASCTAYIESVIQDSRPQADNTPGRPRRNRSHGHGQTPKASAKGKSPDSRGSEELIGQQHSSQQLSPPEATQPRTISKKRQGQRLSGGESNPSSSFGTANSDESWVYTQPGEQEVVPAILTQPEDQCIGLNLDTDNANNGDGEDLPLSAVSTGPAGPSPYLVSPLIGPRGESVVPQPQQAPSRNTMESGFQVPSSNGPSQTPVTSVLATQPHHRLDQTIAGFNTTPAPNFRSALAGFQNANNPGMFHAGPRAFRGMPAAMAYGYPMGQFHPQQLQHNQMQMQMPFQQPQAMPVPVTIPGGGGGTIDSSLINSNFHSMGSPMGMGNNSNNAGGQGFNSFSPGNGDGTN